MNKLLFLLSACASVCTLATACGDEQGQNTYIDQEFKVVNEIDADIVVDVSDGMKITVRPGETKVIHTNELVVVWNAVYAPPSEYIYLNAEMTIGDKVMPQDIWRWEYWPSVDHPGKDEYHYSTTYTLTVTPELLETVKNRQHY